MNTASTKLQQLSEQLGSGSDIRLPIFVILWAFVILATLIAGAFAPAGGLAIIAVGVLASVIVDLILWRQVEGFGRSAAGGRAEPPSPPAERP